MTGGTGRVPLQLPTEIEAQSMLDLVLSHICSVQHLFDPRAFSDELNQMYDTEQPRYSSDDLWYLKALMVFAIGELLQGRVRDDSHLPGSPYFHETIRNLPNFLALRAAGTPAVEILGLIAFYLQCSDCKEDAYVYV